MGLSLALNQIAYSWICDEKCFLVLLQIMINLELILQVTLNLYLCPFNNQKVNYDSKEFINLHQNNCWNLRFRAAIQGGWQISSRTYWKNYLDISINLSPIFFHRRANDSIFLHLEWKGPRASWKLFINVDRHIIIEQVNYKVLSLPPPPPAVDSNSKWNLADWITLTQLLNVNSHWWDACTAG